MNTEQRRIALLRAKKALKEEAKAEQIERKKRLDILALRKERKARAARKVKRVEIRVRRESKALSYKTWKERAYKKKENKIPKDTDFRSAQHSSSQRRYSWALTLDVYNHKTESREIRHIGVSDNKRLSPRAVKEKALKALYAEETSPNFEIYEINITSMTVDREYDEVK